jgi:hypothetical protein
MAGINTETWYPYMSNPAMIAAAPATIPPATGLLAPPENVATGELVEVGLEVAFVLVPPAADMTKLAHVNLVVLLVWITTLLAPKK